MMLMPNLFWRGMIITMIPLIFQLIIVAFLAHFLLTLKNEIVLESRSQMIIARAFVLNHDAMETIYNLSFTFEVTPDEALPLPKLSDNPQPLTTLNANLQNLFNVARVDPDSAARMSDLYSCHKQLIELYKDAHRQVFRSESERKELRQSFFQRFIECGKEYANATNAIVELEEARQTRRPASIHALLSKVWNTLFIALGLTAALAGGLGYLYIVQVKRPLKRTCENGIRLAKGQPLPPAISGHDELATLDRLLHSTAEALQQIEKDEKNLVENAADLICSLSEDGAFINANPFAYRMLGRSPEGLIGRNLNELTVPEESLVCDEKLRDSRRSPDISVFDLRLLTLGKKVIDTRWSCFWSDAQRAFFCVAHDITETKNAERIKQDLVDMISHDLRSPLTSVSISLAILSRGAKGELPAEEKKKIERAGKTVEQLIELVSDLLDFQKLNAKKINLECSTFGLLTLVQSAVHDCESNLEHKGISVEISGPDASMQADKQLLLQALSAALENAVKASPEGSSVRIEITEIGDTAQIRIIDQGELLNEDEMAPADPGIPTKKLNSSGNRSLLKLSICKRIVAAHDGTIDLYNVKPHGCCISIRLPNQR